MQLRITARCLDSESRSSPTVAAEDVRCKGLSQHWPLLATWARVGLLPLPWPAPLPLPLPVPLPWEGRGAFLDSARMLGIRSLCLIVAEAVRMHNYNNTNHGAHAHTYTHNIDNGTCWHTALHNTDYALAHSTCTDTATLSHTQHTHVCTQQQTPHTYTDMYAIDHVKMGLNSHMDVVHGMSLGIHTSAYGCAFST